MKKNYEVIKSLYVLILIFFLFVLFLIVFLFKLKVDCYKMFDSVVVKDDIVLLMINEDDLELFYSNSFIFIDDKKVKFKIIKVTDDILFREGDSYMEVVLSFKFDNKKENDIISFSILEKKIYSYEIFKIIVRDYEDIK